MSSPFKSHLQHHTTPLAIKQTNRQNWRTYFAVQNSSRNSHHTTRITPKTSAGACVSSPCHKRFVLHSLIGGSPFIYVYNYRVYSTRTSKLTSLGFVHRTHDTTGVGGSCRLLCYIQASAKWILNWPLHNSAQTNLICRLPVAPSHTCHLDETDSKTCTRIFFLLFCKQGALCQSNSRRNSDGAWAAQGAGELVSPKQNPNLIPYSPFPAKP